MVALITPDYAGSDWTDQEVGWALGSSIYVLPVRRGADPYGFLGEVQGIQGIGKTVEEVADEIFGVFLRHASTQEALFEALVSRFEKSASYKAARSNLGLLERVQTLAPALVTRIEIAVQTNNQVGESINVPERVERLVARLT
jgi:hypothetical protein